MVFGLFEGKMEIILPKTSFSFSETIEGKLKMGLKKEKNARKLRVVLQAVEERTQYASKGIRKSSFVLFSNETVLDGEKIYPAGSFEYDFKIQAPQKSVLPQQPEGALGQAVGALQMISGMQRRVKWELKASLDVPGKDVSKTIQISVG